MMVLGGAGNFSLFNLDYFKKSKENLQNPRTSQKA
jgi:hypothetical protein